MAIAGPDEEKKIKRPPQVKHSDVSGKDGFILSKVEREYAISHLNVGDGAPLGLAKGDTYNVPEGHSLHGKKLPFEITRTQEGDIYALHSGAVLGKGSFGTIMVAQCIHSSNPTVQEGNYYAVKIQIVNQNDDKDEIKEATRIITDENRISRIVNLNLGEQQHQNNNITGYYTFMPLLQGKELAKTEKSYLLYIPNYPEDYSVEMNMLFDEKSSQQEADKPPQSGSVKIVSELNTLDLLQAVQKEIRETMQNPVPIEPTAAPQTLKEGDYKKFEIKAFLNAFESIAAELETLHGKKIIHLDLKPENIMHDESNNTYRIIDFGTGKVLPDASLIIKEVVGTPTFMPPEFFSKSSDVALSTKQDIYSLGRSFELLYFHQMNKLYPQAYYKKPPSDEQKAFCKKHGLDPAFFASTHLKDFHFKNDNNNPEITALNALMDLTRQMRNPNPDQRPECNQVIAQIHEIRQIQNQRLQKLGPIQELDEDPKREKYFSNMEQIDYQSNVQVSDALKLELQLLQFKRETMLSGGATPESKIVSDINSEIRNKTEQIRNLGIDIRKYERKHGEDPMPLQMAIHPDITVKISPEKEDIKAPDIDLQAPPVRFQTEEKAPDIDLKMEEIKIKTAPEITTFPDIEMITSPDIVESKPSLMFSSTPKAPTQPDADKSKEKAIAILDEFIRGVKDLSQERTNIHSKQSDSKVGKLLMNFGKSTLDEKLSGCKDMIQKLENVKNNAKTYPADKILDQMQVISQNGLKQSDVALQKICKTASSHLQEEQKDRKASLKS